MSEIYSKVIKLIETAEAQKLWVAAVIVNPLHFLELSNTLIDKCIHPKDAEPNICGEMFIHEIPIHIADGPSPRLSYRPAEVTKFISGYARL